MHCARQQAHLLRRPVQAGAFALFRGRTAIVGADHHQFAGDLPEEQTTLKEVFPVGRYGLTPSWGDGHDTGIYTFKMLRRASGLE